MNFKGSEIRFISVVSATTIQIKLSVQDSARDFDWIDLLLELSDVTQAQILDEKRVHLLDMDEGINLFFQDGQFILCHGNYNSIQNVQDSLLYTISKSIKYKELPFSQ